MPTEVNTLCAYCGVGCGMVVHVDQPGGSGLPVITATTGRADHPTNFGRLCSKGASLHHTASHTVTLQTRLLQPKD